MIEIKHVEIDRSLRKERYLCCMVNVKLLKDNDNDEKKRKRRKSGLIYTLYGNVSYPPLFPPGCSIKDCHNNGRFIWIFLQQNIVPDIKLPSHIESIKKRNNENLGG